MWLPDRAERALCGALRQMAEELQLQAPAAHHIRQFAVREDGTASAVIAVPRAAARGWLRGSGCRATFVRLLWPNSTAAELQRHCFRLQWLRGQRGQRSGCGPQPPGVLGLLVDGKDIAVRTVLEVDVWGVVSSATVVFEG